jgi:hypothetical protein
VDVAQAKVGEGMCGRKWMSRMAEGVERFWMMLLLGSNQYDFHI